MATDITLQDYLNNDPGVKEAKKVFDEANKALSGARFASADVVDDLKATQLAAKQSYDKIVSQTTQYFKNNYVGISTSGISESIKKLEAAKLIAPTVEARNDLQQSIDNLKQQQLKPKTYEESVAVQPKPQNNSNKSTNKTGTQGAEVTVDVDSFTKDIEVAGQKIAAMDDAQRKTLAVNLNRAYGTNLPVDGRYSPDLKNAYLKALSDNLVRSLDFNRTIPFEEFLVVAGNEGTYKSGANAGPSLSGSISDPTRAASIINTVFKSQLERDPTEAEVAKFTKLLNAAEKKNPFKTVKGITTGGLDKEQFIKDQVSKLPEFTQKKEDKTTLISNSVQSVAKANGLNLGKEQLDEWTNAVKNGTNIDIIKGKIRDIAGYGLPDNVKKMLANGVDLETIYSPYKNTMASVLEINPATISLDDKTLRGAIGPDKEMSVYDFRKALRKDPRWEYTNNAREEAYGAVNKILQDFGFQG